jgi:F-type H+-transporting ATPase subunit epsilon
VAQTFRCTIVTPTAAVFDEDVTYASLPAWDGQMGVLAGQSPILTRLGIGPMRVEVPAGGAGGAGTRRFWVDGGFAQARHNTLTILTERALRPEEISAADAERELRDANENAVKGGIDRAAAEAGQQRARSKRRMAAGAS